MTVIFFCLRLLWHSLGYLAAGTMRWQVWLRADGRDPPAETPHHGHLHATYTQGHGDGDTEYHSLQRQTQRHVVFANVLSAYLVLAGSWQLRLTADG